MDAQKFAIIKQELMAELMAEKESLKALAEPVLKKTLKIIIKKGLIPVIATYVAETDNKIDDVVWAAIDQNVEKLLEEIIEQIKL